MRPALGITPLGPKDAGGPGDATPPRGLSMRNQNIAPQIDVCRRRHRQRFLTPMETVMGTLPPSSAEKSCLHIGVRCPPSAPNAANRWFWSSVSRTSTTPWSPPYRCRECGLLDRAEVVLLGAF